MDVRFVMRLCVALGDVDRRRPADLVRARGIAMQALRRLAIEIEVADNRRDRREILDIDIAPLLGACPVDGLARTQGRTPDRRMRLLERSRPHVHIFEAVVLALEAERTGLGPGLHHEIMRLVEALVTES